VSTYTNALLDAANAEFDQAVEEDKQKATQVALGGDKPPTPDPQGSGLTRWMAKLPQNIGVGILDAAINTVDFVDSLRSDESKAATAETPSQKRNAPSDAASLGNTMSNLGAQVASGEPFDARRALVAFRNHIAGDAVETSDHITQGIAQFAVPFAGWSKAARGMQLAADAPKLAQTGMKIAKVATAESATMATAFDPHAGRFADLVELGKHTEGKLADALNTIAPDGSAINAYIDYMTDRVNESEAEGRFKNVIDNLGISAVAAGLLHVGAKTLKAGHAYSMSPIKLPEIGSPEHLAAQGQKLADEALMQFPDSPQAAMVHLTEQADNVLDDAERQTILAARDKVAAGAPEQGYTIVPTAEGHTVVAGKQPVLTFEKEEDAIAAVADAQKLLGSNFNQRAAAEHAKASDANFATLHAFSRVLKTNVDRPVSTHSLLSSLERNIKGDTEQGAFYKELLGRLVRKKVAGTTTVSSKPGRHDNSAGHFATAFNQIELYDKAFKDPKKLLHVFTHEAVHAATLHEMNASARVVSQMERLRKAAFDERVTAYGRDVNLPAERLKELGEESANRNYGFTNAYEFVAEIESNPEFRQLMQKTKLPEGGTAWDKYLETIAGILGVGALVATPAGQKEFSKLMMGPKQEEKPGA
jgi:hypothetical protein